MINKNVIPLVTDPMGKHWDQPSLEEILVHDDIAFLSERALMQLHEYSATMPTGVYPGKMWVRHNGVYDDKCKREDRNWLLVWFGECEDPKQCSINHREISLFDPLAFPDILQQPPDAAEAKAKAGGPLTSHQFARLLLSNPDLPIFTPAVVEYSDDDYRYREPVVEVESVEREVPGEDPQSFDVCVISYKNEPAEKTTSPIPEVKLLLFWDEDPLLKITRGYIKDQPDITLFYLKWDEDAGKKRLYGAFIPNEDEREKDYVAWSYAKEAANKYLNDWLLKNTQRNDKRIEQLESLLMFAGCTCYNDRSQTEGCKFHGYIHLEPKRNLEGGK